MNGGRHIPTQLQLVQQEHELIKHHKKLEEISNTKKKAQFDKELNNKSKLFEVRERNLKFHNSEKAMAIEKDNELLLGRLVEISRKKKTNLFPLKTEANLPRTLNGPSRKREKDRIANENEAFARRLLSQQPSFNRKQLETDYGKHQERVKNMQRLVAFSPRIKLPPLKQADFETKKPKSGGGRREIKKIQKKTEKIHEDEKEHVTEEKTDRKNREQKKEEPTSSTQRKEESKNKLPEETIREEVQKEEKHEEKQPSKEHIQEEAHANTNINTNSNANVNAQSNNQVKNETHEEIKDETIESEKKAEPESSKKVEPNSSDKVEAGNSKTNVDPNEALKGLLGIHVNAGK